jgi:POT family proton-dependent oligopeptide transporter
MSNFISRWKLFPKAAPYIVVTELAERFSFYGMKAILPTFLIAQFFNPTNDPSLVKNADAHANEIVHLFVALVYACSIIGGFLADKVLGRFKTIFYTSIIYCLGHLMLAVFEMNYNLFFMGLMLIALGAGGVKPNVTAMVGDQFDNPNDKNIDKLYDIFYFGINVGALISTFATPLLKKYYGPSVAFGVPGVIMFLALVIFLIGKVHYKITLPSKEKSDEGSIIQGLKDSWKTLVVFAFIPVYWALYDQNGSEWVIQASKMDTKFLGINWIAEQIQLVNALMILMFIPIFSEIIYPLIEKTGFVMTYIRKIGLGFVVMVFAFAIIAFIQFEIDKGVRVNIAWQILAYAILTASEVMVSLTGLQYAFANAPKHMKGTIMSLFFLTVFFGNIFVSLLNNVMQSSSFFAQLNGGNYFLFFMCIMALNALLFFFVSSILKLEQESIKKS